MFGRSIGLLIIAAMAAGTVRAQTNIDPAQKFAWGENIGWTNWHDAGDPDGAQGVRVADTFLSGFIWAENAGWINLGDGTPANGVHYANVNGTDFGVNRDPNTDEFFGYAWGENVGWLNFDGGALANPPNPARIDVSNCTLAGFVWAENCGWLNLDDANAYVALEAAVCTGGVLGDLNCDGIVGFDDINPFVLAISDPAAYVATYPDCDILNGDCNGDGFVDFDDINAFVVLLSGGG
jgi:hypothetical protein